MLAITELPARIFGKRFGLSRVKPGDELLAVDSRLPWRAKIWRSSAWEAPPV
jgi:hypothetical protein